MLLIADKKILLVIAECNASFNADCTSCFLIHLFATAFDDHKNLTYQVTNQNSMQSTPLSDLEIKFHASNA